MSRNTPLLAAFGFGGLVLYTYALLTFAPAVLRRDGERREAEVRLERQLKAVEAQVETLRSAAAVATKGEATHFEELARTTHNLAQNFDEYKREQDRVLRRLDAEVHAPLRREAHALEAGRHHDTHRLRGEPAHTTAQEVRDMAADMRAEDALDDTAHAARDAASTGADATAGDANAHADSTVRSKNRRLHRLKTDKAAPATPRAVPAECTPEGLEKKGVSSLVVGGIFDPSLTRPATTMDVRLGQSVLVVGMADQYYRCNDFTSDNEKHDPYIESHVLSAASRPVCARALQESLNGLLGANTIPRKDLLTIAHLTDPPRTLDGVLGGGVSRPVIKMLLRPRNRMPTGAAFQGSLNIPTECFKHDDTLQRLEPLPIKLSPPAAPVAQLSGDVLEQLHDGILLDGGRVGRISFSHGHVWNRAADLVPQLQALLQETFGPVDAGHDDAVIDGWDNSTVAFVLGPRHTARNYHHYTVKTFPPIPRDLVLDAHGRAPAAPLPVPAPISIEDVIRPFAEIALSRFAGQRPGLNAVPRDVFVKGGLGFTVALHAGVFLADDKAAVVDAVRQELASVFGAPTTPDRIAVPSPTALEVTLGDRRGTAPPWLKASPAADASFPAPDTHRVLRFTLPSSVLVTPPTNASAACLLPRAAGCRYLAYTDTPIAPFPAITVELEDRMVFKWAVVGAGPSGMNGLGRVLDSWAGQEDKILWIDERNFNVGRLEGYHDVQSMNACSDFVRFLAEFSVYQDPEIGAAQNPLLKISKQQQHCRLGYLAEPLATASRFLRSKVVSYNGRVTDVHKVPIHPRGATEAPPTAAPGGKNAARELEDFNFMWSIEVGNDARPMWVTDGLIVAIGADHKDNHLGEAEAEAWAEHVRTGRVMGDAPALPPEIPFTTGLNPGKLRTFLNSDAKARGRPQTGKRIAVFGAGPSGAVALTNLALLPEVASVVHFTHGSRGSFTEMRPVTHGGEYLNVTRVKYDRDVLAAILPKMDYFIQCAGWRWPAFPYDGKLDGVAKSGGGPKSKLYTIGVKCGSCRKEGATAGVSKSQLFFIPSLALGTASAAKCKHKPDCFDYRFPEYNWRNITDTYVKPEKPRYAY